MFNYKPKLYVECAACKNQHTTGEVETLDIEEDIQGRDVLTFYCPVTEQQVKSLVFSK